MNTNMAEFCNQMILSQYETIKSVSSLEMKFNNVLLAFQSKDKTIQALIDKCISLETTVSSLTSMMSQLDVSCRSIKPDPQTEVASSQANTESPISNCRECSYVTKKEKHLCQEYRELQKLFNKRVKYEVKKKFGKNCLADNQIKELDFKEMCRIKKKVFRMFSPCPIPAKRAWDHAMNSLRQDRYQLIKKLRHDSP